MKNVLTLNQVQRGVPAYDILIDGVDCGVMTHFPHDGKAMATLRFCSALLTLEAPTLGELIMKLFEMIVPISDDCDDSNYDEDDIEYTENTLRDEAMYMRAVALGYGDPNF